MDEEIELTEAETATLSKETFSFFDVLSGVSYPKDVLTIYMDEAAAYDLEKLLREISGTSENDVTEESVEALRVKAEALKSRIENSKYTFFLTGVSDDRIVDARTLTDKEFEKRKKPRKNASGHIEKYLPEDQQYEWMRYLNAVVQSLHIEQIVAPNGAVMTAPSPDEIAHFYDKAPGAEKGRLDQAIASLRVKSESYEASIDEGFLAKP